MGQDQNEGRKMIWTIGGGKGGSGKSFIAANVGICLSKLGVRVILVDADLGGANLHTFWGFRLQRFPFLILSRRGFPTSVRCLFPQRFPTSNS